MVLPPLGGVRGGQPGHIGNYWSGNVLLPELVLERLIGRGHKGPSAAPDEGDEVSKRLAAAGASFDECVLAVIQSTLDQAGHQCLAPSGTIVAAQQVSDRAIGRKDEGDVPPPSSALDGGTASGGEGVTTVSGAGAVNGGAADDEGGSGEPLSSDSSDPLIGSSACLHLKRRFSRSKKSDMTRS